MKICTKCKENKELTEFYKIKLNNDGLSYTCKKCMHIKQKEVRQTDRYKKYYKEYKDSPEFKKLRREWYTNNRKRTKAYTMKHLYGITIEKYDEMLKNQNYCCSICKKPSETIDKRKNKLRDLAVDHCHKTGKVRGLLCDKCNRAIGFLQDDPELTNNATIYLKSY